MKAMKIYQVDAFTDRPFCGNPAGVCILKEAADDKWMQNIASEMNLAETAFLLKQGGGYNLRWFTPEVEIDLCGHATLASAHILWETGELEEDREAVFHTKSGRLSAKKNGECILLDFPAEVESRVDAPEDLKKALGVPFIYTGRNRMDYIVEVENGDLVRNLMPDHLSLKKVDTRGVIVTSRSDDPAFDFISRFFVPGAGIDEDPVTGSSHCCLGPYWGKKLGKQSMTAYQASRRGGALTVSLAGDRVYLGGKAVTVFCADWTRARMSKETGMEEIHPNDYNELISLWSSIPGIGISKADSEERIRGFLLKNPGLSFCYKEDNRIVGTILCGQDGRRGYIYHTAVAPEQRGRGIGRILVEESLRNLHDAGIDKCHIFVFADNEPGNKFWESIGWEKRDDIVVYSRAL